jgi:alkylhydroperoxidase family enzyme
VARAGKVFGILRVQSLNPPALAASIDLYKALLFGRSVLTRVQREMLAVVVSKVNGCFY